MFSRFVSILLIVTIIACPLWCGSGIVAGGPQKHAATSTCSIKKTSCCCCERSSESPRHDRDELPEPSSKPCQGICAGAVFDKPLKLCGLETCGLLPVVNLTEECSAPVTRASFTADSWLLRAGDNPGRSLRTLYLSFLC